MCGDSTVVLCLRYLVQRDQIEQMMELYKAQTKQAEIITQNPEANIELAGTGDDGEMDFFTQQQNRGKKKNKKKKNKSDTSG